MVKSIRVWVRANAKRLEGEAGMGKDKRCQREDKQNQGQAYGHQGKHKELRYRGKSRGKDTKADRYGYKGKGQGVTATEGGKQQSPGYMARCNDRDICIGSESHDKLQHEPECER